MLRQKVYNWEDKSDSGSNISLIFFLKTLDFLIKLSVFAGSVTQEKWVVQTRRIFFFQISIENQISLPRHRDSTTQSLLARTSRHYNYYIHTIAIIDKITLASSSLGKE